MFTSRPDSFEKLIDSIKQEYGKNEDGIGPGTENEIKERCRDFFEGQVFLSHTAKDYKFCENNIVPVLKRFGLWSYFFLSVGLSEPNIAHAYKVMVEYSLYYCKTVIFAVSEASLRSNWVKLEAKWAVEQRHPRIVCLLDSTAPHDLHLELGKKRRWAFFKPPQQFIPFFKDIGKAQSKLDQLLHSPEFAHKKRIKR